VATLICAQLVGRRQRGRDRRRAEIVLISRGQGERPTAL